MRWNSEQETELAARTDGTIVLRTKKSKRVIWSFASGSPIYSSYQAPPTLDNGIENASLPSTAFFIDCGDDWELYAHATPSNKMVRDSFLLQIFHDGRVCFASQNILVFLFTQGFVLVIYYHLFSIAHIYLNYLIFGLTEAFCHRWRLCQTHAPCIWGWGNHTWV